MNIQFANNPLLTQSCLPPDEWDPWRRLRRYSWPRYSIIRELEAPCELWGDGDWCEYPESIVERALENQRSKDGDEDQGDFDPSRREGAIKDQLACYVPYPVNDDQSIVNIVNDNQVPRSPWSMYILTTNMVSDLKKLRNPVNDNQASNSRWGIYFRATKMLSDFKEFHKRLPTKVPVELSWRVYVSTVFWHEMAHHVVQDVWLLQEGLRSQHSAAPSQSRSQHYCGYTLMPRSDEEGFCEYMAFSSVEQGFSIPRFVFRVLPDLPDESFGRRIPLHIPLLPGGSAARPDELRAYILFALYDHWGRACDPDYRPRVTERASESVGPLWRPCWESHRRGVPVIYCLWSCDLIWNRIFVTDK